ncbi:MAG: hypothetical protein PHY14_02565 [Candidatus Gracilibacteria bacterium]|nr:hypothetical protein [Candidatus Gracilibacteria bacterium]
MSYNMNSPERKEVNPFELEERALSTLIKRKIDSVGGINGPLNQSSVNQVFQRLVPYLRYEVRGYARKNRGVPFDKKQWKYLENPWETAEYIIDKYWDEDGILGISSEIPRGIMMEIKNTRGKLGLPN